jgi:hypothetical protein
MSKMTNLYEPIQKICYFLIQQIKMSTSNKLADILMVTVIYIVGDICKK